MCLGFGFSFHVMQYLHFYQGPFLHLKKEEKHTHSRHVNAFLPPSPSSPLTLHPPQTNRPSNPSISTTVALPTPHPTSSTNALAASYPLVLECSLLSQSVCSAPQRRCGPAPSRPIRHLPARMELIVEPRQVNTDVARFRRCRSSSSGSSKKGAGESMEMASPVS